MNSLRARLAEAEEALRAIRAGEVDTILGTGTAGPQVFSLGGAEHPYRVLIESMNEGALMLATDRTVLYANQCFARLVRCPLEDVTGSSLRRFLSVADWKALRPALASTRKSGSKLQLTLTAGDGLKVPVQISIRPLPKNGFLDRTIGIVVTDMTEARRTEAQLRALSQRLVDVQEAERGRIALELDDNITQPICAILVRSQTLADRLQAEDGVSKNAALELRQMLGTTAEEVERLARNLRPGVLRQLGLVAGLRGTGAEFAERTGVVIKMTLAKLAVPLPADSELALYRILQEALKNVGTHAFASNVTVSLKQRGKFVQLAIHDDGVGFDADRTGSGRKASRGLGVLSMRERATHVGGTLTVKSKRRAGTEIDVRVPMVGRSARPSRSKEQ